MELRSEGFMGNRCLLPSLTLLFLSGITISTSEFRLKTVLPLLATMFPSPVAVASSSHTKECMQDRKHEMVHISKGGWYAESKYTKIRKEIGHGPRTVITHKKKEGRT
jgi:hypothetical protein